METIGVGPSISVGNRLESSTVSQQTNLPPTNGPRATELDKGARCTYVAWQVLAAGARRNETPFDGLRRHKSSSASANLVRRVCYMEANLRSTICMHVYEN